MKKFLFLFIILFSFQVIAKQLAPITVGWEIWYPYQYQDNNNQLKGLDVLILNAIAEETSTNFAYIELPWKRHLMYLKKGEVNIAMGSSRSREREEYAYFTDPYRIEEVRLFVIKGKEKEIELVTLADVIDSSYIIGTERGYYYGDEFKSLSERPTFKSHFNEVTDLNQNIKMLLKGHIDGLIADPIAMNTYIKMFNLQGKFSQHSLDIYKADISFMLSKTSMTQADVTKFNQAISALKKSGKIKELINNSLYLK
jgi:polar amino acid transport system substrate-binding protein